MIRDICGTPAGYKRHYKQGEPVCQTCKDADRERRRGKRRVKAPPPEKPGPDWDAAIKRFRRTLRTVYGNR